MANRIIDDETALTIFEALQETSTRNFSGYDCMRELPSHKINGELVFYLDELIDFAERELKMDPSEALGQVVDQGVTAWFASLDAASQRKLGFSLKSDVPPAAAPADKDASTESLQAENRRLTEALEAAAAEKVSLKREIAHLEQVNEELSDQQPASLSHSQGGPHPQGQPNAGQGYMMDNGQSGYMALTAHSLSGNATPAGEQKKSAAQKKNKRRRKKKSGSAGVSQGRPK